MTLFQKICGIVNVVFISYYAIQEIREVFENGLNHLIQFWTLVEFSKVFTSFLAFSLFLFKLNESTKIASYFKQTSGYGYYKLQNFVFWSLLLDYSLGFCLALGTLKFLKVFRFNKRLSYVGLTMGY
jgi:hypothetical protein